MRIPAPPAGAPPGPVPGRPGRGRHAPGAHRPHAAPLKVLQIIGIRGTIGT